MSTILVNIYMKNVVYKLTCTKTNKSYYGMTTRGLDLRWKEHILGTNSRALQHLPLYQDLINHPNDWTREVIFVAFDKYVLKRVENIMIIRNDTILNGYNIKEGDIGFDLYKSPYTELMS